MKHCFSMLDDIDRAVRGASRILVASDFDGTLCPIAATPDDVRLNPAVSDTLRRIATCDRMSLAVITGRALSDIVHKLPRGVTAAGNHGLEIEGPSLRYEHEPAACLRASLGDLCDALDGVAARWPGAWVEDKGLSATVHYRGVARDSERPLLMAVRGCVGSVDPRFALRAGKKALEIRPKVAWDKGSALDLIRKETGPFDLTVCIGDDRTDEAMFSANTGEVNVWVGTGAPACQDLYRLGDSGEVAVLLRHLLDLCQPAERAAAVAVHAAVNAVA